MNLSGWLTHLETLHPEEIELGLDRVRKVALELGLDFRSKTVVSVAGTNGKGSTSCFLESLLLASGKSIGLYSSPHLLKYNERIRVNGAYIEDSILCHAFSRIDQARKEITLTYFEFSTLAALLIFSESEIDYIILEVGLGGRLDAVNIIDANIAIITNIALDHTEWLGDTREKIAFEKAGIIREGRAVIFGEDCMPESLGKQIKAMHAKLYQHGKDFDSSSSNGNWCWRGEGFNREQCGRLIKISRASLLDCFPSNGAMALQAASLLNIDISEKMIEQAYTRATLPGRFQVEERGYTLVLDVAHNAHAAQNLSKNIQYYFPNKSIHILIGMSSNKDTQKTLASLQEIAVSWYVASLKNRRGTDAEMLYNELQISVQKRVCMFNSVQDAFLEAEQNMEAKDVLLVTGSFYTVAGVLELI